MGVSQDWLVIGEKLAGLFYLKQKRLYLLRAAVVKHGG